MDVIPPGHNRFEVYSVWDFIKLMQAELVDDSDGFARPIKDGNVDYSIVINCKDVKSIPKDTASIAWISKSKSPAVPVPPKDFLVRLCMIEGCYKQQYAAVFGEVGKFYVYNFDKLCFSPLKSLDILLLDYNKVTVTKEHVEIKTKLNNTFKFKKEM